jgi:hypothetical protein
MMIKMNGLDRHIGSIHIIRNMILNLTLILFNLLFLTLTLTLTPPPLLLLLLLLLIIIILILLLVDFLSQIALLTCIGTLIFEISFEEFLDRPTIWESM